MELKLSERINRFRKNKNLTQEELANALGVSSQAVSNWERGGYPDITLLPVIARFFEVSIDELMGNETAAFQEDYEKFEAKFNELVSREDREGQILLCKDYIRQYPNELYYSYCLGWSIYNADYEVNKNYRGEFRAAVDRVLNSGSPVYWGSARIWKCLICGEDELKDALRAIKMKYDFFTNAELFQSTLSDRARFNGNDEEGYIHYAIGEFLNDFDFVTRRCSDEYGASIKADFLKSELRFYDLVERDGILPAGWLMFRGRVRLVLAACLWADGKADEGWEAFENGMADVKAWYSYPEDEPLPLDFDGKRYAGIRLTRGLDCAVSADGVKYPFYERISDPNPEWVEDLLTNPRWAWFNSARNDPRYLAALEWAKSLVKTEE